MEHGIILSNGSESGSGTRISPMEMEAFQPILEVRQTNGQTQQRRFHGRNQHPIDQLLIMIRLHMEYYPKLSALIITILGGTILYYIVVPYLTTPDTRNRLSHDYSKIDLHYNWKASQIDHWCLWGGDDTCHCDDFTEPLSREEMHGWVETHQANIARIDLTREYDIIFYGDEMIEGWNGKWLNMPLPTHESKLIAKYWNETFTKQGGGQFESLALGIKGDVTPNLLWRLEHGEMPATLRSKVFWLLIGTNDLARGGCSEDAVFLGIIRLADELHFHHPESVVVIQGILPRTIDKGGALHDKDSTSSQFHYHSPIPVPRIPHIDHNGNDHYLWPSIRNINQQLASFCENHDHLVYFDADALFLGSLGNEHYRQKGKTIISDLMPDMVNPSYDGYMVMGKVIQQELTRIIYERNEDNDIEVGPNH